MPFTVAHIAAVLPFARPLARWRLLSASIIGSMVPDFGLLLPTRPARIETHSLLGLFTFCLPVGLATFWIFQRLIKRPVVEILPDGGYQRCALAIADLSDLKQWLAAACGVLIGAVTHLVWDGFTHEGARGVRMIPSLDDPAVDIAGHHIMGTRLLQDLSSLVGMGIVLLLVAYALRPGRAIDQPAPRRLARRERFAWLLSYLLVAGLVAAGLLARRHPASPEVSFSLWLASYAVAALRGCAAALLIVSVALNIRLAANSRSSRRNR